MKTKKINLTALFFGVVTLLCCSISPARADIQKYRQDLKQAVRTLPEASIVLHDKLFDTGQVFETVGVFSEARRAYQYLDLIWDKYPPTDNGRHQLLKKKIAALKKKQDTPLAGAFTLIKEDALGLYQEVYHPGQRLECRITRKQPGGVWLHLVPITPSLDEQEKNRQTTLPVLYPTPALDNTLQVQLPDVPAEYMLNVYDSRGLFLTQKNISIQKPVGWAGKLKVETRGYPGLGGTAIAPGYEFNGVIHNSQAWLTGVKGKRPWVGLFRKETPDDSKKHITYWYINQKEEFTRVKYRIKEPGEYQLRIFSEDSKDQHLLLKVDLMVGNPQPVKLVKGFSTSGSFLVFDKKQRIEIAGSGLGLDVAQKPDFHCLVVPSWFAPKDIRHGLNHALSERHKFLGRPNLRVDLPQTGGSYDILYYPHWRSLKSQAPAKKLAVVQIKGKDYVKLVLPQTNYLPGANIRAGIHVGGDPGDLNAFLLPGEHLQVNTHKAKYVRNKRYAVSLNKNAYTDGSGWFDITAPLTPGHYFLTVYNRAQLCAALPLTIVAKEQAGALIQVAQGPYQTQMPFKYKVFQPVDGIPEYGIARFIKDEKEVLKQNLYKQYMDYPGSIKAPEEAGTYQILFFVKGDEQPKAQTSVTFFDKAKMVRPKTDPDASSISPEAVAAFGNKDRLEDSDFAQFNLFASRFVPGQEMLINYSIPQTLPACLVLLPKGPAPSSLARALKQALTVKKLDSHKDIITLTAPEPGSYRLYVYDTLQWTKAGPPSLITQMEFTVQDVYHTKIITPEPAFAKGNLVLTANTDPEPGFSRIFKDVYLYSEDINTVHNRPGSLAKARFKKIKENVFQAILSLDVEPGNYQLVMGGFKTAYPIRLTSPPTLSPKAEVHVTDSNIIPNGLTTIQLHPSSTWNDPLTWALAGEDDQGNIGFIHGPEIIKSTQGRVIQTTLTAPTRPGEYHVCFWEGTGKEDFFDLPASAVRRTVNVRLDKRYLAVHQPEVELQAYFAQNKALYAGMHTTGRFTASIAYDPSAWIGILPKAVDLKNTDSAAARKAAIALINLGGKDRGTFSLRMPETPGRYQLCMYDNAKNGRLMLHRTIILDLPDMEHLEQVANEQADAFLEALPDYDEDIKAIEKIHQDQYEKNLEVPSLTPISVPPELLKQLEGRSDSAKRTILSQYILAIISPSSACAAGKEKKDCETDIDLALENMRKVNINFGDGVDLRRVVGELATKMATDLVMGQKHVAQAKAYYDKTQGYYDKAMKLKSNVEKNGWEEGVKGALWDSTQAMLKTCVTGDCLSRLGKKAIEHKLKSYNPLKMTPDQQAAWKKEYTRMVVLLDDNDLKELQKKTAKFADLAGQLSVPNPDAKALEMARAAAINTMKGATMAMVTKIPGWSAVKAYYETLNVLRGGLINAETVDFMDEYRKLRAEGGTISQVNDILSGRGANYLRTSLRNRIEANPKGYKEFLTPENRRLAIKGLPIKLDAQEIDDTVMGHLEKWYQKEKKDKGQDKFYKEMKDAWYNSKCKFDSYMTQVKGKSFFDTVKEGSSHLYDKASGLASGKQTYSSMTCARKALAFKSYLDLRAQVLQQMASWQGKDGACQIGKIENQRLQDQLVCEALINPGSYKQIMAANAKACGALPKPLPPKSTPKVKELSKKATRAIEVLLKRSGNIKVLKCLCNRYSIMGSGCSYHPEPTKGRSPSCDNPGPPCMQGNWGCGRRDMASDSYSLQVCQVGKAIREFKRKDNKGYQKWLEQRKKYMAK
ncbi:hypothetical protein SAMN02746065_1223 [Desulfocicer vacuolatum DSM 3385]|uniref:MG2 domain-containing protein n=1 Tax=Desulfocicer vacuolatum DSM 3385 TaxID=1121400 RepID=A0A1W2DYV2_9BACT|nr:hypothetical protein [Desulfocicer vacuolatum]SMD02246.1 hypothetical protein SAMN02746065_1223 [Desulfocicer vacuolatum DSM 3385]